MPQYLSTDPNAGQTKGYLSTDPNAGEQRQATPPPAWALHGSLQMQSTPSDMIDPGDLLLGQSPYSQWKHTKEHPVETLAMLAIPSVLGAAAKYGGPLVSATARAAATPAGQATIGAAYGGYKNGPEGALYGGVGGYLSGKASQGKVNELLERLGMGQPRGVDPVAAGMSQKPAPTEYQRPAALDALMRGANYDDLSAIVNRQASVPQTPAAALQREVMARQGGPIDWRTTDAVPINAMQTKGIIEPGESIPGLGDRAAAASKAGDQTEVERLLRAIRQRQHITEKSGGARTR